MTRTAPETAPSTTGPRSPAGPRSLPADRAAQKVADRRAELAAAALKTLAELGYARTSLRDIAQNSGFSHGVLHYYFRDKTDLITFCVRRYKAECVTRYDHVVATASTAAELEAGFLAELTATLQQEAHLHRLWYDFRSQSMFEPSFREDVAAIDASLEQMIWTVLTRAAELAGQQPRTSPRPLYAVFDGLFQQALLRQLQGDPDAAADLRSAVVGVLRDACG